MSSILSSILNGAPSPQNSAPAAPAGPGGDTNEAPEIKVLRQMIQLGKQYLGLEDEPEDQLSMHKIMTSIQQLIAAEQADADGALQGKVTPKQVRKAMSPAAGGPSGNGGY